ncbi:MAG: hypothetical protein ABFD00_09540 [Chloroherpetonaceae bacterium]
MLTTTNFFKFISSTRIATPQFHNWQAIKRWCGYLLLPFQKQNRKYDSFRFVLNKLSPEKIYALKNQ